MSTCSQQFKTFLTNIEPAPEAVEYAIEAHSPVRDYLINDEDFGKNVVNSFLYGSYKRHTAVGDLKDVDIILLCNFDTTEITPSQVLNKLKTSLSKYYNLPNNEEVQSRSVKVNQPIPNTDIELTLDIVPAVIVSDEESPVLVPDLELGEWKLSHPKGHIANATNLNSDDYSGGMYIPLVKLIKWWWKLQAEERLGDCSHRPKGFWLESLTSEYFKKDCDTYAEHFYHFLKNVSEAFEINDGIPNLPDPGLPGETIGTSLNQEEFNAFLEIVNETLLSVEQIIGNSDDIESCLQWRDILGDEFPLIENNEKVSSVITLGDYSHQKLPLWPQNIKYTTTITSCVGTPPKSSRSVKVGNFPISDGYKLSYKAETNTPDGYETYWQVVNTGEHARTDNGLRGGFDYPKNPDRPLHQTESTKYGGRHWIQCFIVKEGVLVSVSNKFYITVISRKRKFKRIRT